MPNRKRNNKTQVTQRIDDPMLPRLLPLKKAAEYIGLTEWSMRERIWAGQIPVVQFPGGRKMFIDTKDRLYVVESLANKVSVLKLKDVTR